MNEYPGLMTLTSQQSKSWSYIPAHCVMIINGRDKGGCELSLANGMATMPFYACENADVVAERWHKALLQTTAAMVFKTKTGADYNDAVERTAEYCRKLVVKDVKEDLQPAVVQLVDAHLRNMAVEGADESSGTETKSKARK